MDELVIIDTGSTDDSPSIAARSADVFEVWTGCNDAEGRIQDFSAARNRALEKATGDVVCWFDGDDVVRGADQLRKLASEAYTRSAGQAWAYLCPYEYERDAAGRVVTMQWRERMVYPRAGWEWRGPVHEGLLGKAGTVPTYISTDLVVVQHELAKSKKARDPARNLRILEAHVRRVGEADPRSLHYFGAELMRNQRLGEAMGWFKRHVALAPWSDERCLSLMNIARFHYAIGDYAEAIEWALRATATKSWPEPHWLIGMACCEQARAGLDEAHNYARAVHFLQRGFQLDDAATASGAQSLLMRDPTARYDAHGFFAPLLAKMGRIDEAIASAEAGYAGKPELEHLRTNLHDWKRAKVLMAVAELERGGIIAPHVRPLIETALREGATENNQAVAAYNASAREAAIVFQPAATAAPGKLDIVFFLGHQMEPWTPRTLEEGGMGGSETMAWEMSKRLAALGHTVRVYAHTEPGKGETFDGVQWFDEYEFPGVTCDLLICSRRFDGARVAKYKAAVLWVHDVHLGEAFAPVDAMKFDFIWCLSEWHKKFFLQCYAWLPAEKVEVTRNGIDPARFANPNAIRREPHKAIYSSSPDRGLTEAVEAWPRVREAIPDAELHVFYGFDNWERALTACMNIDHPHCGRDAMNRLKLAIAKTPGIVLHGRVNQRELAEAMLSASVWAYGTWFSETSCITAMEAQAAGLWCVCPPVAALAETVVDRYWTGDFAADVVRAMEMGAPAEVNADRFSLDSLAAEWDNRLQQLVASATQNVVPRFHEAAQ